jgi:pimeloyl-ACP methyl ester carboxylesterase
MITIHRHSLGNTHFTYRMAGSGPDVLLIHGWISSGRMWEALMHALSPYCRLWAIDLVGFGDSWMDDPSHLLTFEDQSRLVTAFCKSVGLNPYAIIGHSMGGSLALKLALDGYDPVQKLVLISPVITGKLVNNLDQWLDNPVGQAVVNWTQLVWPQVLSLPQFMDMIAPPYLDRSVVSRTLEDIQKATWGASFGWVTSMRNLQLLPRLEQLRQEVLLFSGAQDGTVPPEDARITASLVKNVKFIEDEECHHQFPDERPEQLQKEIIEFLGLEGRSASAAA